MDSGFKEAHALAPPTRGAGTLSHSGGSIPLNRSDPIDTEDLRSRLRSSESVTSSQLGRVEASLEQMLHEAAVVLRKDIARERTERQTALFELRRDLSVQQASDLATLEDRLSKRWDAEGREQKAAILELRSEVGVQQDHRVQLATLRRDLGTTQAALSKLAVTHSGAPGECSVASSDGLLQSTAGSELSTSTGVDVASIADLRREVADLRGSLEGQALAAEGALEALRRDIPSNDDVRAMQRKLDHSSSEFARGIENVASVVGASTKALRAELRFEIAHGRPDGELTGLPERAVSDGSGPPLRDHSELSSLRALLQELGSRLDGTSRNLVALGRDFALLEEQSADTARSTQQDISRLREELAAKQPQGGLNAILATSTDLGEAEGAGRGVFDEIMGRVLAVEASVTRVSGLSTDLDEVRGTVRRLVERERSDRCTALAGISCRADDALDLATSANEELARGVSDVSPWVASETACSSVLASPASSTSVRGVSALVKAHVPGGEDHAACAASVSELESELRTALCEHMQRLSDELRGDLTEQVACLKRQVSEGTIGNGILKTLPERVEKLELDVRLRGFETHAHHGAVRSGPTLQPASAEQVMAPEEVGALRRAAALTSLAQAFTFEQKVTSAAKLQEAAVSEKQRFHAVGRHRSAPAIAGRDAAYPGTTAALHEPRPKVSNLQPMSSGSLRLPSAQLRSGDEFPGTQSFSPGARGAMRGGEKHASSGASFVAPGSTHASFTLPLNPRTTLLPGGPMHPGRGGGASSFTGMPSTVGTVQLPLPTQAKSKPMHFASPAVPAYPVVTTQSGPSILKPAKVSERQRRPPSPPRGMVPTGEQPPAGPLVPQTSPLLPPHSTPRRSEKQVQMANTWLSAVRR